MIQPADKGSGVCILDRVDYENEAKRQLTDTLVDKDGMTQNYYEEISENSIKKQYDEIKKTLDEGVKNKYFSAKQMLPVKPKAGSFYLLPKVHKKFDKIPKGRPIIPGCGSNTEISSWFCDQALKDSVKEQESYIQDTPDLLRFCEEVNENGTLPEETKPVAIDLKSMSKTFQFRRD